MKRGTFVALFCAAAALLLPAPARAGWYCTGQRLWTQASDTGWVAVFNTQKKWVGYRRVRTSGVNACAAVQRVGTWMPDEPLSSPVDGKIMAKAHQNLLSEITLKYRPPPTRPGQRPTKWTQTTWNRDARWRHRFKDYGGWPEWSGEWRSQSFAADRCFSRLGLSHKSYGDGTKWDDNSGRLGDLNSQPTALAVTQHCVAWVEAHMTFEGSMAGGYVCGCAETWATDWGSQCSGCP